MGNSSRHSDTSRVRVNPDSFDKGVIRKVVHSFCERKECPTVSGVLEKVRFPGGDSVCGASFRSWDLATRNETTNNTFMNKEKNLYKHNHRQTMTGKHT